MTCPALRASACDTDDTFCPAPLQPTQGEIRCRERPIRFLKDEYWADAGRRI